MRMRSRYVAVAAAVAVGAFQPHFLQVSSRIMTGTCLARVLNQVFASVH
jgi:uncharacterized protein (DUF2062 family)